MTFSIAARCPDTGMFGVAAATSSLCVGSRCTFVRAGVGAVLTQHRTDPRLGPRGLDFLAAGLGAQATIDALVASTPHAVWRQLAVVDGAGETAFFHGSENQPIHAAATGQGCVAIGNILRHEGVCGTMVAAMEDAASRGFAERLVAALEAGERAGGEVYPLRSAVLLIADRQAFPLVDLRVDDHAAPLRALASLWEAFRPQADSFVARAVDPERGGRATNSLDVLAADTHG